MTRSHTLIRFVFSSVLFTALAGCNVPTGKCTKEFGFGFSPATVCFGDDTGAPDSGETGVDSDTHDSDTDTDSGDTDSGDTGDTGDSDTDTASLTDADGDGYIAESDGGTDCDDSNANVHPDASESCNGVDDDCDGGTDEDVLVTYYADTDGDGYGDENSTVEGCDAPSGYVENATDCDDTVSIVHPGAAETDCTDLTDYNCDGSSGAVDGDGDGFLACEECDDGDSGINPGATEVCNGVDDDCEGSVDEDAVDALTWYADSDGDTFGDPDSTDLSCAAPTGYVSDDSDCDDSDRSVNPGEAEVCDGIDNDCSGGTDDGLTFDVWFRDADSDGYGDLAYSVSTCDGAPAGYVGKSDDCDDGDGSVNPGATEVCNGVDDDCEGTIDEMAADALDWYADVDGDGYGDVTSVQVSCDAPDGYISDDTDCDDGDGAINPGAVEQCDGVDDDCDGATDEAGAAGESTWYLDSDGDGFGAVVFMDACDQPSGYVADDSDCDDSDSSVYPGATETIGNGVDEDCDGSDAVTTDADGDGYDDVAYGGTDCDDGDSGINPGATEVCNGTDDDCDGGTDEGVTTTYYLDSDADGYGDSGTSTTACFAPGSYVSTSGDCDDADSTVNPGEVEVWADGIDNDCDGVKVFYTEDFGISTGSCTVGDFVRSDGGTIHQSGACVIYVQEGGSLTAPSISINVPISGFTAGHDYDFEWLLANDFKSPSTTFVANVDGSLPNTTIAIGGTGSITSTWTADSTSLTVKLWTTSTSYYDGELLEFTVYE